MEIFRLTSTRLATGDRTVLRTWVGADIKALHATGGVVFVSSDPGHIGQWPSQGYRVIGLVGRSGTYQPIPMGRASG